MIINKNKSRTVKLSILLSIFITLSSIHSSSIHSSSVQEVKSHLLSSINQLCFNGNYSPELCKAVKSFFEKTKEAQSTEELIDLTNNCKEHISSNIKANKSWIRSGLEKLASPFKLLSARFIVGAEILFVAGAFIKANYDEDITKILSFARDSLGLKEAETVLIKSLNVLFYGDSGVYDYFCYKKSGDICYKDLNENPSVLLIRIILFFLIGYFIQMSLSTYNKKKKLELNKFISNLERKIKPFKAKNQAKNQAELNSAKKNLEASIGLGELEINQTTTLKEVLKKAKITIDEKSLLISKKEAVIKNLKKSNSDLDNQLKKRDFNRAKETNAIIQTEIDDLKKKNSDLDNQLKKRDFNRAKETNAIIQTATNDFKKKNSDLKKKNSDLKKKLYASCFFLSVVSVALVAIAYYFYNDCFFLLEGKNDYQEKDIDLDENK